MPNHGLVAPRKPETWGGGVLGHQAAHGQAAAEAGEAGDVAWVPRRS
jgi:hypothetical protein